MSSPLLGHDIGLRRTGVALSESGLLAQPLTTLEWSYPHISSLAAQVNELVRRHEIKTVVAGLPFLEDEQDTDQARTTQTILDQLEAACDPAVTFVTINEFHSSRDAAALFPDTDRDAAAAAVILQDYLEQNGEGS